MSAHTTERPAAEEAGRVIGRYRLVRRLAVGGMAEIFLARARGREGLERLVVLKRILPQYLGDDRLVRMFLNEARMTATLGHPNVVQVHDVGRAGSHYFFTMEYVHGVDARRLADAASAAGRAIPLEHALRIVIGAAAGLHHAHEQTDAAGRPRGIVHRDVSPSNVLVGFDGAVKIGDFGIAKGQHDRTETQPGTVRGKLAYMSPEQCLGEPLDRRSDVFSLGVLLHELTTGVPLFTGETDLAILNQILGAEAPPPSRSRAGYPPELERVVLRALSRRRAERHATAQELLLDLERVARDLRLAGSPATLSRYVRELFPDEARSWRERHEAELAAPGEPLTAPLEVSPIALAATSAAKTGRWRRSLRWVLPVAALLAAAGAMIAARAGRRSPAAQPVSTVPAPRDLL